ncbi:mechanosensitive ion channel family protein [Metallibacterium scheffleri]
MAAHLASGLHAASTGLPARAQAVFAQIDNLLDLRLIHFGTVRLSVGALLAALLILGGAILLSYLLRRMLTHYATRYPDNINRSALYTLARLGHYTLLLLGVMFALSATGIPVSRFAVFFAALGVGLGFGLQAIFNNFISGLILLFERSLKVGDFVELASGVHGEVRDINIRATRINTNDDVDILVPNSEFVSGRLVNWTLTAGTRRIKVPFGVAYGSDKEQVREAGLEAAREVPHTLAQDGPHAPQVWLSGFGASSLDFELVVWVNADATRHPGGVSAAYNWSLHSALARRGIELPFPQRDLHLRSWFGLTGAEALQALRESTPRVAAAPSPAIAPDHHSDAAR